MRKGILFFIQSLMESNFNNDIYRIIAECQRFSVRMIMVGGSAVNFYGYKRHSADIDFWIDNTNENLESLIKALRNMGFKIDTFPNAVLDGKQNVSIKMSPDLELELILSFNSNKTFDEAYKESEEYTVSGQSFLKWNIISYSDLVTSKIKSGRPKDFLDIQELERINKTRKK